MKRDLHISAEVDLGKWVKIGHEFSALEKQFRAAQDNPKVLMPTALSLAIEGVLQRVALPASPYAPTPTQRRSDVELSVDGRQIHHGQ